MKILLITDQHFGVRNDNIAFLDYFEKFYKNVVFPFIEENNITNVIDLGDTFDRRKFVNYFSLKRSKEMWFDELEKRNIQYDYIVGNHTSYFKNTISVNSPELMFGRYRNFNIIEKPTVMTYDGVEVVLIPWICQDNEEETMALINSTRAQILLGHLEISGFEMYKGVFVEHGISPSLFSKFEFVASGHLHHRSTRGNIHYLGCPYEMTWSDYNDPKGFHVFDTETRSLTFIPNPYTMFNKIYYSDVDHTMSTLLDFDASKYEGVYVKIIVEQKTNPYWFDMFLDKIEKVNPISVEVVEDDFNIHLGDDSDITDGIEDTVTILTKYVESLEIETDKKSLNVLLRNLYDEAVSIE